MLHVPEIAASRPFWKGRLVPYTVAWFDGVPDFKVVDPEAVRRCVGDRLCGICGKKIGARMTFIGGPTSLEARFFLDPAMHAACARYAASACPFLHGDITEMADPATIKNADKVAVSALGHMRRPEQVGFLHTKRCRFVRDSETRELVILADPGTVEWAAPVA